MKRILLCIIALTIVSLAIHAQKANMIFFAPNEEPFFLVVNGIQQNAQAMSNVKITDMAAPMQYQVRIKFADAKLGVINDKVYVEPDTEKSWSIQSRKKKGTDQLEYVVKNAGETDLVSSNAHNSFPPGQVIVYHAEPLPADVGGDGVSFNMNVNEQGANVNFNMNTAGSGGRNQTSNTSTSSSSTITTSTSTSGSGNASINGGGCNGPLNQFEFRSQLERVRSQGTAAGKKLVAQKIAQQNCLTARQVYELCDALILSSDKLDLAKFCYQTCFDPQNYEEVYKAMPTSSMVKDLDDYVTRFASTTTTPIRTQTTVTTTVPAQVGYVPGYNGPYGCAQPMSAASFASAKSAIADASFEDTKMSTAKTIIGANCITTDQLIEICNMFDFEDTKLKFAKFAYNRTYDKGNYFKVNKVFDFDASKEELNRFVQNAR